MNGVEKILESVKEKHVLVGELEAMLGLPLAEFGEAIAFLGKYKLVDLSPSGNEEGPWVQIMPSGLQLLNLPNLPEEELPSDQLEVSERHWGGEVDEGRKWLFLMQLKNKISCEMGRSQCTITIEQQEDKFVLTAMMPKREKLHLQEGDISKCHHTPEEVKEEVEKLFQRRMRKHE